MPTKEKIEAELDRARRDAPKYRVRANGYLIIPILAAIYVVGGIVYLRLLFDPSVPAAANSDGAAAFFPAFSFLTVCVWLYIMVLMAVNAALSRPVDFLVIIGLGGVMWIMFYAFFYWAKPHLVVL